MRKKIIIYSNFNTPNYMNSPYLEESSKKINLKSWIDGRMDIFFDYTLKSLMAQTNQDFTAIYNYTECSEKLVLSAIQERGGLPSNVLFVPRDEYEELVDDLVEGYDQLYLTKLDSDDMYVKTFVDTLHNLKPKDNTEVVICNYGYMYDVPTGRMTRVWHMSPSFHSYIYRLSEEIVRYYSLDVEPFELLDKSHFLPLEHNYEYLPGNNFMWDIHRNNASTKFQNYNTTVLKTLEIIDSKEKVNEIMSNFI